MLTKTTLRCISLTSACIHCGTKIKANKSYMCGVCLKANSDVSSVLEPFGPLNYCAGCGRYDTPPWKAMEPESSDLLHFCLKRIKNLSNVKLIDSCFVWTEPHSKRIKVKLTVRKEVTDGIIAEEIKVITFVVNYVQCRDCQKTFTPHTWLASIQARHKTGTKMLFLKIEQALIKAKLQRHILDMSETRDGVDFFFATYSDCETILKVIKVFK